MTACRPDLSVVIPSYNGLSLLCETLPSVLEAADVYQQGGATAEVIVVEDAGSDATAKRLPELFPSVRLVERSSNGGFAKASNSGFSRCRFPLVGLLNNDVRVERSYFVHQAAHFVDPEVFGVTARVFDWDGSIFETGGKLGRFRRGFWSVYLNYDVQGPAAAEAIEQRRLLSSYAVGGFAMFDRTKLEALGGFCELLSPFHWEDIDLSYRAWKRGWLVRYEPRSIGYHRTSATIKAHFPDRAVNRAALRNRLLFHWINLHSSGCWLQHLGMLALLTASRIFAGDADFYRALASALSVRGEVAMLRARERAAAQRSDLELAGLWRRLGGGAGEEIYYNRADVEARHPGPEQSF